MIAALLSIPAVIVIPWVFFQIQRVTAQQKGNRVDPDLQRLQLRKMGTAIGAMQCAIALLLIGFSIHRDDPSSAFTTAPALLLMGAGFIVWGTGIGRRLVLALHERRSA